MSVHKQVKIAVLLAAVIAVVALAALPGLAGVTEVTEDAQILVSTEIAYALKVNGESWAVVRDKAALEQLLEEYKKSFLTQVDPNAVIKGLSFRQAVEIAEVEILPAEIVSLEAAKERIYAVEEEAVTMEVQPGDNLWNLAREYDLTMDEFELLNPGLDPARIYPGDELVLKPFSPVLDVTIELVNTVTETIPFATEYQDDNTLYTSQKKALTEGVEGQKEVTYAITLINGYQESLEIIAETILQEPVTAVVLRGTKTTVSRGGAVNYGVVSGTRISSTYGYRTHPITGTKKFHKGLDIAAPQGNSVYAFADGKVIEAGWNGGYGNWILIDHGNGLKSGYGHLSKISVKTGQRVGTGEKIGAVGSTGDSTGPHLHFEIIKNGSTVNPLNYL